MTTAILTLIMSSSIGITDEIPRFQAAKPIWPSGREKEKNLFMGFRADFALEPE